MRTTKTNLCSHNPLTLEHQQTPWAATITPSTEPLMPLQTGDHAVIPAPRTLRRPQSLSTTLWNTFTFVLHFCMTIYLILLDFVAKGHVLSDISVRVLTAVKFASSFRRAGERPLILKACYWRPARKACV